MYGAVGEMGSNCVAGVKLVDGTDDRSVLREQAVSHAVDALGVASGESLFEQFNTMPADENLSVGSTSQPYKEFVYPVALGVHPMN